MPLTQKENARPHAWRSTYNTNTKGADPQSQVTSTPAIFDRANCRRPAMGAR